MDVAEVIRRLGSVATWAALRPVVSRAELRAAVEAGRVVRLGQGRYALPAAGVARRAAHQVNGVVSHLSAALYWGLEVKLPPAVPVVTVPRGRKLGAARRAGIDVRWRTLAPDQVHREAATQPAWTVVDCARTLPFDEALAVADSALRSGLVSRRGCWPSRRRHREWDAPPRCASYGLPTRGPTTRSSRWSARSLSTYRV